MEDIYVIGRDGGVRRLDVVTIEPTRDAGGNIAFPLKNVALTPDGRTAAFAQPNEVIVVDLTTATFRRLPVPGLNEQILWRGRGTVAVGQDQGTVLIDLASGSFTMLAVSVWDAVSGVTDGAPAATDDRFVTLTSAIAGGAPQGPATLQFWSADGRIVERSVPVKITTLPNHYDVFEWNGPGWRRGDLIARAGFLQTPTFSGSQGAAIVDLRSGAVVRPLDLGFDYAKGWCVVLGWLDADSVLIHLDQDRVLAWNIRTGEVTLVAERFDGRLALSDLASSRSVG